MSAFPIAVEVSGEPVPEVVEVLASLFAEARAGRIRAVAIGMLDGRGDGDAVWAWSSDGKQSLLPLMGIVERVRHRLQLRQDEINRDRE